MVCYPANRCDSNRNTFLVSSRIGISACGVALIDDAPISRHVESLIRQHLLDVSAQVDDVARMLLEHFRKFDPVPRTIFHVAGYKDESGQITQHVWLVDVAKNTAERMNTRGLQGVAWGGPRDILKRQKIEARDLVNVLIIQPQQAFWIS